MRKEGSKDSTPEKVVLYVVRPSGTVRGFC
jgi:hypothetical protein